MSKQDRQGARTPADLERKYNFGQSFAEVYGLITDAQRAAEEASKLVQSLTPEEIFNRLTNYGEVQGIYRENDQVYINAVYIKGGKVKAEYIDADNLQVNAANITGTLSASQIDVSILETDNLYVYAANILGTIQASQIDADSLTVQAANIEGMLNIDKIRLYGKLKIYEDETQENYGGYVGFYEGEDADGNTTYGIELYKSLNRVVLTNGGIRLRSRVDGTSDIVVTENINLEASYNIWLTGDNIYSSTSISNVSDRRKKNTIQYDVDKYLPIFDALSPASFYYNEHDCGKRHLGFVAQDVEKAMVSAGITHEEFAPLDIRSDGYYGLRYEEFIPLLVAKIKQLEGEVRSWKS